MGEGEEEETPLQGRGSWAARSLPPLCCASRSAGPAAGPECLSYLESLFEALLGNDSLLLAGLGLEGGVQGPE